MGVRTHSYLFRAVVLGTLLIVASIFAVGSEDQVSAPNAHDKAHGEAKDVGPHKSLWVRTLDDAPGFWTAILAGLTVVLAGVGVVQIAFLRRADETARVSANAALKAANTAEAALISTEAPFIFAKAEQWREGDPLGPGDQPGFASITLHNYGRSPAIVRDFYPSTIRCVGLPAPLSYPPLHSDLHRDEVIPVGQSGDPWRFMKARFDSLSTEEAAADPNGTYWIIGQVRYADAFGAQYVTGFCFALNPYSGTWSGMGGSRYNYRRRLSDKETEDAEARDAELPPTFRRRQSLIEGYATHHTPPSAEA